MILKNKDNLLNKEKNENYQNKKKKNFKERKIIK